LHDDPRYRMAFKMYSNNRVEAVTNADVGCKLLAPHLMLCQAHHAAHSSQETVHDSWARANLGGGSGSGRLVEAGSAFLQVI
jgi:hypothetical protein